MVLDFLEKYQEELTAHKIELKEDYDLLLSKIKENEKFLQMLKDESDSVFSEFTPRDVNHKNKNRIEEVSSLLSGLYNSKAFTEKDMQDNDYKIKEIAEVINIVKKSSDFIEKNTENQIKDSHEEVHQKKLKHSLENISGYVIHDPARAKLELDNIIAHL